MNLTTSTTRSPNRATSRHSRLSRAATAVVSALSIAGLALASTGSPASAAPQATADSATHAAAEPRTADQWQRFCLSISSWRGGSDSDCGRNEVSVHQRNGFNSIAARAGRWDRVCVAANWDSDCSDRGWARARTRGFAFRVGLRVENAEVCVRARVGQRWFDEECGDEDEWVYVRSRRWPITGLRVMLDYRDNNDHGNNNNDNWDDNNDNNDNNDNDNWDDNNDGDNNGNWGKR